MLSASQNEVQVLIENKLSGSDKDEAFLLHISVERKLASVDLWLRHVEKITLPAFVGQVRTYSYSREGSKIETENRPDLDSALIKMSAYIDAFFMSGRSILDAFGHEIRSLYGLGGHAGDLYFKDVPGLLKDKHCNSSLSKYLTSVNVIDSEWYRDLNSYRTACAHESIIQIKPSLDLDVLTGKWGDFLLKLPIDPKQRPLSYNGKNFVDTGKTIRDELYGFAKESYDKILNDIKSGQTKIDYDNGSAKLENNS